MINSDPDEEVNGMGSMDDNVEDKRSKIQTIKIKINLVKKQVMSMDEYWEEGEEVKGLEKDSRPMCPHPQVSPPTPTNCVKDEYGEKAEEVKSQGKASKPHASPLISTNSLSNCVKDVLVAFDQSFERYCFYQTIFSQTEIEFVHL